MNIVTGMHRSGTTYVGKVLDTCTKIDVFHEPFNRHFGLKGIDKNYPAVDMGYELNTLALLKSIELRASLGFIRDCNKDKYIKRVARKLFGGKTEQQWRKIRYSQILYKRELVLKDPFLSMSTQTLSENLGCKVLYLCRHPAAVWSSIKHMNWKMDLKNFFGANFPVSYRENDLEVFCEVWNTLNSHNSQLANPNFLFMTHEELCIYPMESFDKIFKHFGLNLDERARDLISSLTSGTRTEKADNTLHQFKRNSSEMVELWKKKLTKSEISYICTNDTTKSLLKDLYTAET